MGGVSRQDHGTQRFLLTFEASFWIYHASLESDHATRTIEDMKLATAVVKFLHLPNNRALRETDTSESKLISGSGRVVLEQPGITNTGTGAGVITTRLGWMGQSQVNYGDS
jgi:hypothetical protein